MFLLIQGSEVKHAYSHPKRQEADEQLHYQQHEHSVHFYKDLNMLSACLFY